MALGSAHDGRMARCSIVRDTAEDMALLHFTSGTTGRPRARIHVHDAVVVHHITGKYALDLHAEDMFWCTADPGWVTGTSYGIIAPLTNGVTMIVDEAEFDAERWYRILQEQKVTVWYTAPTAIRMLMKAGAGAGARHDLSTAALCRQRRRAAQSRSRGLEQRDPRPALPRQLVADRNRRHHDRQLRRHGHQARLDGPAAARASRRRSSSAAKAAASRTSRSPMQEGELALKAGWPSMFRGYLNEDERYRKCFVGDWYLTGDLAMRDADGYYWFVGRADDVIKSAGHLIGPFEVESALMEHPAVAEAAVIGKPDPVAGEMVKAFVALKPGYRGRARRCARSCWAMRASGSAPPWRRRRSISAGPAADPQRQDHAPAAEGARTGPARGRYSRPWKATSR